MKQTFNYKKIILKIIKKQFNNSKNVSESQNIKLKSYNKNLMKIFNK